MTTKGWKVLFSQQKLAYVLLHYFIYHYTEIHQNRSSCLIVKTEQTNSYFHIYNISISTHYAYGSIN
jgi:hypothetical protein